MKSIMGQGVGQRLPYASGKVKIICEGNSLMLGYGKETGVIPAQALSIAQHLALMPIFSTTQIVNLAVGGSVWTGGPADKDMSSSGRLALLQAEYDSTKDHHVVILWEDSNAIYLNAAYTGEQVALQCKDYIQLVKARIPGAKIVVLSTIPRYSFSGEYTGNHIGGNNVLIDCDNYRKANWKDMGIDALVDLRRTGKFIHSGTEYMPQVMKPYQMDGCHLNGGGYGYVADLALGQILNLLMRT